MSNKELTKQELCLIMRNGIQIWLEKDRAKKLQIALSHLTESGFIELNDRTFNTADILGIFTPQDLDELTRRKNGQWKCEKGMWHNRNEECTCKTEIKDPRGWTK